MNKEEVYDLQINPLMAQIISICQEHKIAILASFFIPTEEDNDLACISALLSKEYEPRDEQIAAYDILMHRYNRNIVLNTLNQQGEVVQSTVIL